MNYAGGVDTNALYFTGTAPSSATSTISLTALDCADHIKDMCDQQATTPLGRQRLYRRSGEYRL